MQHQPPVQTPDEAAYIANGPGVRWIKAGAQAVWTTRNRKRTVLVEVVRWVSPSKVEIRDAQGQQYKCDPERLHEWVPGEAPIRSTVSAPTFGKPQSLGFDPMAIDPRKVREVAVKVRGKLQYRGPVTPKAGQLLSMVVAHKRHVVVTLKMEDGTTQRYRGNGVRLK